MGLLYLLLNATNISGHPIGIRKNKKKLRLRVAYYLYTMMVSTTLKAVGDKEIYTDE